MSITEMSTRHWPSVAVAVALVALFGLSSIASLLIQLLPTIEEPQVSVACLQERRQSFHRKIRASFDLSMDTESIPWRESVHSPFFVCKDNRS